MAARALGPPPPPPPPAPPLGTMRAPPRAADASAPPPHGYRRGAAGLSLALTGHRGRHTLCSVQLTEALRVNLQVEANSSHSTTALMSTGRDDSAITCKGFCTISWNLKADVRDGYVIFVTGDPVTLGCWEPGMAVQLSPSVKSSNEWTAEIKVIPLSTEIIVCQMAQSLDIVPFLYRLSKVTVSNLYFMWCAIVGMVKSRKQTGPVHART